MKVYLSADIEGVCGITDWSEADRTDAGYPEFRERMTAEVAAACEGALEAGASEILVKDAHASGRNLLAERLPREARLVRGLRDLAVDARGIAHQQQIIQEHPGGQPCVPSVLFDAIPDHVLQGDDTSSESTYWALSKSSPNS